MNVGQHSIVYHHVFTSFACHKLPENNYELMLMIMDVITNVSSLHSGTSNSLSQSNSMVDSWTTKCEDDHSSTSIFDENIGEDGLSIQSTYGVNTNNPYNINSIAPNSEILDSPSLNAEGLKGAYTLLLQAMVLAGSTSQLKWHNSLKASRWSKR